MNLAIGKFIGAMVIGLTITGSVYAQIKVGNQKDGGIVFWVDSTGTHGLIADIKDLGKFNWNDATNTCKNKGAGWYLPSQDEIEKLLKYQDKVGGFADEYYWSSSESSPTFAYIQHIPYIPKDPSSIFPVSKTEQYYVRAVRAF